MAIALTFEIEAARSRRVGVDRGVDVFFSTCVCVLCVLHIASREESEVGKKY